MTPDPLQLVLIAYLAMVPAMAVLWVLHLWMRNASLADVGWCLGLAGGSDRDPGWTLE